MPAHPNTITVTKEPGTLLSPAAEVVSTLFDSVDEDSSGFLEEEEGLIFLGAAGYAEGQLDHYWKDLLRAADQNGDGKISKTEFVGYILSKEELDDAGNFLDVARKNDLIAQVQAMNSMNKAKRAMRAKYAADLQALRITLELEATNLLKER